MILAYKYAKDALKKDVNVEVNYSEAEIKRLIKREIGLVRNTG